MSSPKQYQEIQADEICKKCGGWCCQYNLKIIEKSDPNIDILVEFHKIRSVDYEERENDWLFTIYQPCPYFSQNRCTIYEKRPLVCKIFPSDANEALYSKCEVARRLHGDIQQTLPMESDEA